MKRRSPENVDSVSSPDDFPKRNKKIEQRALKMPELGPEFEKGDTSSLFRLPEIDIENLPSVSQERTRSSYKARPLNERAPPTGVKQEQGKRKQKRRRRQTLDRYEVPFNIFQEQDNQQFVFMLLQEQRARLHRVQICFCAAVGFGIILIAALVTVHSQDHCHEV
eukprot:snap_masked-scaffold_1-processed-gene-28.3-mRNA-1 protein AED:1.00 eAED:1.00 QI:0/-1/0/0/-1/1/1/0/164